MFLKNVKLFCLLILIFIFSGCTVKYDLVIDNKKHVSESVTLLEPNDNLLKYAPSVEDFLDKNSKSFGDYKVKKIISKLDSGYKLNQNYSSLYSYKKGTFFKFAFDDAVIDETDSGLNFNTSGEYHRNKIFTVPLESVFKYSIDEVIVNIQFYNEILTTNSDSCNKSTNTCTWIIKKDDIAKQIKFSLSDKVRNDIMIKDFINKNKLLLLLFGGIIFLVVIFVKSFFQVMDKNNRI